MHWPTRFNKIKKLKRYDRDFCVCTHVAQVMLRNLLFHGNTEPGSESLLYSQKCTFLLGHMRLYLVYP